MKIFFKTYILDSNLYGEIFYSCQKKIAVVLSIFRLDIIVHEAFQFSILEFKICYYFIFINKIFRNFRPPFDHIIKLVFYLII
jgi:hypothetical protein